MEVDVFWRFKNLGTRDDVVETRESGTRWRLQALVLTNGDSQKCSQQSRDPNPIEGEFG